MAKKPFADQITEDTTETIEQPKPTSAAEALARINSLAVNRNKSKDLIGVEFDILDAKRDVFTKDGASDPIVVFTLKRKDTGEEVVVSKAANIYTTSYADYFSFDDAAPMLSQTFYELESGGVADNRPITIRPYQSK